MNVPTSPLAIMDCSMLIVSLGRSAPGPRELRDHLLAIPAESLAHHFHDSLLRPSFDHPEYRNDFARWAARQLRDEQLAEQLGVVDPTDFPDLEPMRQHLIDLIEDRLAAAHEVPTAPRGGEFHFLTSQFVVFDTQLRLRTPDELGAAIRDLSTGSIYFHFIEARRRNGKSGDDFSRWLEQWGPGQEPVCRQLRSTDYYMASLTELRERIAHCFATAPVG